MARKKKRKLPIFLAIIILIILLFGIMLKWNSGYTQSVSGSTNAYNKLKDAVIAGGTVSLSSDDINSVISNSFEAQTHKGVTIKNIYVNMSQNKLDIKIPTAYKGQNFLVSSTGKVALKEGCIVYLPDSFKLGAIPLPKNFILNKLKAMYSSKFTVEDDGIYINKSALPVTINSIEIKDNNLNIGVEKLKLNLSNSKAAEVRDELLNTVKNLNASDKAKVKEAIKYIENNPNALNNIKTKLSGVSNSEIKKIVQDIDNGKTSDSGNSSIVTPSQGTKKIDTKTASELSEELGEAAGKVKDSASKAVINAMQAQVASGTINSSLILPQVKALNQTQRDEVQDAVKASVKPMYFIEISNMLK